MTEEEMNDKLNQFFGDDTPEENDTDSQTAVKAIEKHQSAVADIACLIADRLPEQIWEEYRSRYNSDVDEEMALAILSTNWKEVVSIFERLQCIADITPLVIDVVSIENDITRHDYFKSEEGEAWMVRKIMEAFFPSDNNHPEE